MEKLSWTKHTEARVLRKPGYPMVEIIWYDTLASAVTEWAEEASTDTMPTTTIGYLVRKDRWTYTIASMINLNHIGHVVTIPKGCVEEVRYLAVKRNS